MDRLSKDLVFIILQFLGEEKFKETAHCLEQESGFYFNMRYFEEKVLAGEWNDVEKYLSGFTKEEDNRYSMKIYFELRKQKYFEALDRKDKPEALNILVNDLKVFSRSNKDLYKELTQLVTLENFRENEQLSMYGDIIECRSIMMIMLKKLFEANPLFRDKLDLPSLRSSRLRTLINHSVNWQHQMCKYKRPYPDINTLYTDHSCGSLNAGLATPPVSVPASASANPVSYPIDNMQPFSIPASVANPNALADWVLNAGAASSVQPAIPNQGQVSGLKRPITQPVTLGMVEYHTAEHEQLSKRLRTAQPVEKVTYPSVRQHWSCFQDNLPRKVALTMQQGTSCVRSMDFHPFLHTLLLVGYSNGEVALLEVRTREKLLSKPFNIWNAAGCSAAFQACKDAPISVSGITWSPNGDYLGAAFDNHLIHLYAYAGANDLSQHLEIDAHIGKVNDLAFTHVNKQLCVVTCGDDKLIKVWDMSGRRLFNFAWHDAPVYSICPHQKENVEFIFSTSTDGKIKAGLYDNKGSRVDYDAPGLWCIKMLYSTGGNRLFSCGTSKNGKTFLDEWNDREGTIKKSYSGFRSRSASINGVVQFDTTQNRYLAAGEDSQIKFWHMDSHTILTSTDAEGGLPNLPYVKFNKEGSLLAVTTTENGIKILANEAGFRSLERSLPVEPLATLNGVDAVGRNTRTLNPMNDVVDTTKFTNPIRCRIATMNASDAGNKVSRLLYTNSGSGILVLGSSGLQQLWKWVRDEQNPSGKATSKVGPHLWKPSSGLLMANDVAGVNLEEARPCIALSKNDSYLMSACGGKVSLFNMLTYKVMATFMSPPQVSTFLAFHPQDNNIVAVGMEDSTINIYNVRGDEVKSILKGHQKPVTGLAFSTNLNILISSGADAHICTWSIDTWEKINFFPLQLPDGKSASGDTLVQFYSDQVRFLVTHETQLALYDAARWDRVHQWIPQDVLSGPISNSALSCTGELVYASFYDGNIGIFDADNLRLRCRLRPSVYLSLKGSQVVYPVVVAAHPHDPHQFAVGLTDGSVKVIEPLEPEW